MREEKLFSALPSMVTKCLTPQDGDFVVAHVKNDMQGEFHALMLLLNCEHDGMYYRPRDHVEERAPVVASNLWCNLRLLHNHIHKTNLIPEVKDECKREGFDFDQIRIATGSPKGMY